MRKRSTSGTQIVSFSCDSDLANRFKHTIDEGNRSAYLTELLRTNMGNGTSYSCNATYANSSQPGSAKKYVSDSSSNSQSKTIEFSDDELRELKRRLEKLKE